MESSSSHAAASPSLSDNWSERVEDLVDAGDIDAAIALLETLSVTDLRLSSTALLELSKLYSAKGLSLKADALRSRAASVDVDDDLVSSSSRGGGGGLDDEDAEARVSGDVDRPRNGAAGDSEGVDGVIGEGDSELSTNRVVDYAVEGAVDDDDDGGASDWETAAEHAVNEFLVPHNSVGVSEPAPEVSTSNILKRRGRGTFSYQKRGLYSDEHSDESNLYSQKNDKVEDESEKTDATNFYGTHHVLVLDGFVPSTSTSDLEKLFVDFKDHEFIIRWINDTVAIAVFQSPSLALKARKGVTCPFTVRVLEEDDAIFSSISARDLEPPRRRPQTSARAAHRMIAQSMGLKMPSSFGSTELRKQEEARRNRIVTRQTLIDEAWGPDELK